MSETERLLLEFVRLIIKPENAMIRAQLTHTFAEEFDKGVETKVKQIVDAELAKV